MVIKRLITNKQKSKIKEMAKFKGKQLKKLTPAEKEELLELVAKKLNIL